MTNFLTTQIEQPRFNMMLLAVFAGVAMMLAAIGIYGVIAYNVTHRTREIGIRMALGARTHSDARYGRRQGLSLVAIGIAIGFLVALGAMRAMATLLYGVGANDISIMPLLLRSSARPHFLPVIFPHGGR